MENQDKEFEILIVKDRDIEPLKTKPKKSPARPAKAVTCLGDLLKDLKIEVKNND